METQIVPRTDLLALVQAKRRDLSIVDHDVAVRRPLADLVETTVAAAARSTHTARAYRRYIAEFVATLGERYLDGATLVVNLARRRRDPAVFDYGDTPSCILLLVDPALVTAYRQDHPHGGHAVGTFLAVALRENVLTQAQALALGVKPYREKQRRSDKVSGRRLSVLEVQALRLNVNTETAKGKRDLAILDLMLFAGLRREEIAGLRLSDFRPNGGQWVIVFSGKGRKRRKVDVHKRLYQSLTAWVEVSGRELGQDEPVFLSVRKGDHVQDGALTSQAVANLVAAYGHLAGLAPATGKDRLSPHDLRRTFARRLYDCGVGLPTIQRLLGHSDPKTTALYIGVGDDDAADAIHRLDYGLL